MSKIITLGNLGRGNTQSRTVYDSKGVSPTLTSGMSHGNTIPYIIEEFLGGGTTQGILHLIVMISLRS